MYNFWRTGYLNLGLTLISWVSSIPGVHMIEGKPTPASCFMSFKNVPWHACVHKLQREPHRQRHRDTETEERERVRDRERRQTDTVRDRERRGRKEMKM